MEDVGRTAGLIVIVLVAIVALPPPAAADLERFLPKIYDTGAEFEIDLSYQTEKNRTDGTGRDISDTFLKENLNLFANGFIYHPRFVQFLLKGSAGLKEENYKAGSAESGWTTAGAWEYDLRALVLPEHPYNLEVFTVRREPIPRWVLTEKSLSVAYSTGAIFRYKEKPYFVGAHYIKDTTESGTNTFTSNSYGGNGTYFKEYRGGNLLTFDGSYRHMDSASLFGGEFVSDGYLLGNFVKLRNVDLQSSLGLSKDRQEGAGVSTLVTDQFSWSERLRVRLPWNFESTASYTLLNNKLSSGGEAASPETVRSTRTDTVTFELNHKLYESLQTSYRLNYFKMEFPEGESKALSHSVLANYSKKIPRGRLSLTPGFSRSTSETIGALTVINESHPKVFVPGPFLLNNQLVDAATITVYVRSPDPPFELIKLDNPANFTATPSGNTFRIDITTLPPPFTLAVEQDFVVFYSLVGQDVELQTDSVSFAAGLTLFDDLITLSYGHLGIKQKVLSGTFPAEPQETTADTFGIRLQKSPYTLSAEYQEYRSNTNPSTSWKTEASYQKDINPTLNVRSRVFYSSTDYPNGTSGPAGTAFTEKSAGADAGILLRIPRKNLSVSLTGSYFQRTGLMDSRVTAVGSSLSWRVAKLVVNAGANASIARSEFHDSRSERISQLYFLNLKRKFY